MGRMFFLCSEDFIRQILPNYPLPIISEESLQIRNVNFADCKIFRQGC